MTVWPGVLSWGLVTGVAMVKSGLDPAWAVLMNALVFAGSAQLAGIALIATHASVGVVVITCAVINLRFVLFSSGISAFLQHLPLRQRLIAGYLNGDMNYLMMMQKRDALANQAEAGFDIPSQTAYHLGLGSSNWVAWQASTMVGIALANVFPVSWGLGFAAILALVALLASFLKDGATLICVISAGSVALMTAHWPYRLGLLAAIAAGVLAAMAYAARFNTPGVENAR